jgi:asparagine synthase (glutamine-hydrolysing)
MIENGIGGWVRFNTASESAESATARMLQRVAGQPATRYTTERWGEAFAYGEAGNHSFAEAESVSAIIKGRPRWPDAELRRMAADRNDATALLECYGRYGPGFLDHMRGSFALALVDGRKPWVILAVDRMGIERLCLARTADGLGFGTSAEVVAQCASDSPRLNRQAVFDYLYREIVPSPETIFDGVEKLLPGQCATFDGNTVQRKFYWHMRYRHNKATTLEELEKRFCTLLREAIARETDADGVGAFLSGGTDSSTVSGLLTDVRGVSAHTFSIGFPAQDYDEMEYARIAARHFGTQSHEYYVTPRDVAEAIPLIARAYDEPFGNASAVPTYFCARLAQENGMRVLLAGDGGDELFGGNARYAKQKVFEHFFRLPGFARRPLESIILSLPGAERVPPIRKAQSYVRQACIPLPDRLETYNFLHRTPLEEIFEPDFLRDVDAEHFLRLLREVYRRTDSDDPVDCMMHLDLKFILADSDLRKVVRMCEVAGVEARFPMLADELVEFSGEVPGKLKVKGTELRFFFKHALRDFLPRETLSKSKHGFGLPYGLWLATDEGLAEQARDALRRFAGRGIVRTEYIEWLWRHHADTHASYFGVMIWILTQLEFWLQYHFDSPPRPL